MTDRVKGLVVVLEHDIRIDDVQPIIDAIKCIRGVLKVDTSVVTMDDHMNRERIRREKIWEVLYPESVKRAREAKLT